MFTEKELNQVLFKNMCLQLIIIINILMYFKIRQLCREHSYGWSRVQHVSVGYCRPRRL